MQLQLNLGSNTLLHDFNYLYHMLSSFQNQTMSFPMQGTPTVKEQEDYRRVKLRKLEEFEGKLRAAYIEQLTYNFMFRSLFIHVLRRVKEIKRLLIDAIKVGVIAIPKYHLIKIANPKDLYNIPN